MALQQAKENGLRTTLITNGLLLNKKVVSRFASFLDLVQLPLDGADADTVREMRGDKRLFKKTIENISLFNQELKFTGDIKIGVMLSAKNVHSAQDIPEVIWKRSLGIDYLKFTQFVPIGEATKNANMFLIPEKQVLETVRKARNKRNYPYIISYSIMSDRTVPKLVLKADGQIYLGWTETTPICSMENFNALAFSTKHCHEINQIIEYNQLVFSSRA
jgi:MoaA/NifB/PqqE/SkfB family radical SAM enzyme